MKNVIATTLTAIPSMRDMMNIVEGQRALKRAHYFEAVTDMPFAIDEIPAAIQSRYGEEFMNEDAPTKWLPESIKVGIHFDVEGDGEGGYDIPGFSVVYHKDENPTPDTDSKLVAGEDITDYLDAEAVVRISGLIEDRVSSGRYAAE